MSNVEKQIEVERARCETRDYLIATYRFNTVAECAHAEALEMDAELHGDHYTYVKPYATSLVFKTDGRKVWWWSFNRGVWFPDFNASPSTVHNHVTSGNGEYCANPAP